MLERRRSATVQARQDKHTPEQSTLGMTNGLHDEVESRAEWNDEAPMSFEQLIAPATAAAAVAVAVAVAGACSDPTRGTYLHMLWTASSCFTINYCFSLPFYFVILVLCIVYIDSLRAHKHPSMLFVLPFFQEDETRT